MLLGAGWVVNGDVSDFSLPPQQIGTLSVNVHDWKRFIILERVQSPSALGDASLGWLVVLDHHAPECVRIFCQRPRQSKVGLLFLNGRLIWVVAPSLRLSEILLLVFFTPLAVFSAPLVVLLSLSLLRAERFSLSVSVSAALSLPRSVRLPPAPPLLRLVVSSPPLIAASPMLLPLL